MGLNELSVFDIRAGTFEEIELDYEQMNLDLENYFVDNADKAAYEIRTEQLSNGSEENHWKAKRKQDLLQPHDLAYCGEYFEY